MSPDTAQAIVTTALMGPLLWWLGTRDHRPAAAKQAEASRHQAWQRSPCRHPRAAVLSVRMADGYRKVECVACGYKAVQSPSARR